MFMEKMMSKENPSINIERAVEFQIPSEPSINQERKYTFDQRLPSPDKKLVFCGVDDKAFLNKRIASPIPNDRLFLTIPHSQRFARHSTNLHYGPGEEFDIIQSYEILAKAFGLHKSFSTSDIHGAAFPSFDHSHNQRLSFHSMKKSFSEMQLIDAVHFAKLEDSSRSLSTWVAVGDKSTTSQLPSPQTRQGPSTPAFTPTDLVRSVNKRIRQNYIQKRHMSTYRALERMSHSGFNLKSAKESRKSSAQALEDSSPSLQPFKWNSSQKANPSKSVVSPHDVACNRGKALTKFERNVIIFDWLHTLDRPTELESN